MSDLFQKIAYNAMQYQKDKNFKDYNESKALKIVKRYCKYAAEAEPGEYGFFPFENQNLKGYSAMWAHLTERIDKEYVHTSELMQSSMAHACLRWLQDKIYYKFDEELEKGIQNGGIADSEEVPAALLNRLPYSSFFVETRGGFNDSELNERFQKIGLHEVPAVGLGFFCTVSPRYQYDKESDALVNTGEKVMDIAACSHADGVSESMYCAVSMVIPKEDDTNLMTIQEAMISPIDYQIMNLESSLKDREYNKEFSKIAPMYDLSILLQALQYVLYLCAENNEIHEVKQTKPKTWASKKEKIGSQVKILEVKEQPSERIFPNKNHIVYERVKGEPTGQIKSPHVRRGHWAYRWVGHGNDKELKLRWVRETRIHPELDTNGAKITVKSVL